MSCIHDVAMGMHRAYALPDGTLGPCILCENERLTARVTALESGLRDLLAVAQGAAFGPCRAFRTAEALLAATPEPSTDAAVSRKGTDR